MKELHEKTFDYLASKIAGFKTEKHGRTVLFDCPVCKSNLSANTVPHGQFFFCKVCAKIIGGVFDFVRVLEPDKANLSNDGIADYLIDLFEIPNQTSKSKITSILDKYVELGFDLVPIQYNGKVPFEKEWPTKSHKDITEWKEWLEAGLNLGVKTGALSNVIILDVDAHTIPETFSKWLLNYTGVFQRSTKGFHFFFKYDPDIKKGSFELDGVHIDVESAGGQVVVYPSVVEGVLRQITIDGEIPTLPAEFKKIILDKLGKKVDNNTLPETLEQLEIEFNSEDFKQVNEGNRTNFLIHFGGILRKSLNIEQTTNVLDLVNSKFITPPLPKNELHNIVGSLDKYIKFEEKDLAVKALEYLKIIGEATSRDVKEVVLEPKAKVDKALAFLVREGYALKGRGGLYHAIKRANWKDTLPHLENRVKFKVPYFYDIAHFNYGDMVLLGSKSKWGKTTISMNIVKQFVDQGIKPYYISLETGSRFIGTAIKLGLKEGDFNWAFEADPTKIELEKEGVTIIDWLLVEDKAMTDTVMKHFVEQLFKTNGFIFIFVQLKENGDYFAPNMIKQFPAMAARYFYDDEKDGTTGSWFVDAIREGKDNVKTTKIACKYDWTTKIHNRVDEIVA